MSSTTSSVADREPPIRVQLRFVRSYEWLRNNRRLKLGKIPFRTPDLRDVGDYELFNMPLNMLKADMFEIVSGLSVPKVFYNLADLLVQKNGRTTEGVFRVCGSTNRMNKIKAAINANRPVPDFAQTSDLAGLMKKYLREQPQPLLAPIRDLVLAIHRHVVGEEYKVALIAAINLLSPRSFDVFVFLVKYLAMVNAEKSKMDASNLGMVFSECLFHASDNTSDIPKAKSVEESRMLNDILCTYIQINRSLQGLPAAIRQQNDGDDIDSIRKTFALATQEKRKRRMSLKGSELVGTFKDAARSIHNQASKMIRRKSIPTSLEARLGANPLAQIPVNVAYGQNQVISDQCNKQLPRRISDSFKRKAERAMHGPKLAFATESVDAMKRRRQVPSQLGAVEIMPTRQGTSFRSPISGVFSNNRTRTNPSFLRGDAVVSDSPGIDTAIQAKVIVGERANPAPAETAQAGQRRSDRRRLSIRSRRRQNLNTSVWSKLKKSNPVQGETILDVLTHAPGPIIDADGAEVYMV